MIEENIVTICAGGGGVSVIETNQGLQGVEAVIDKDFASEKLAELVDADLFIILTGVDYVYVNFNQPNQKELHQVSTAELKQYVLENQFAPGSMLPKIEAAIAFVEQRPQAKAVITSLENLNQLLKGNSGTIIYKE
ncbi:amino acid kinase [Listeria aquatica FSL S10-1188]|uniref:carbamate kinase n=1 Tax=Listeria aquatica FSL S10-1188 TaxID=1265818 RepID=W7B564_9LIST|nr:amino acid kinase [Listeria aquatica FSL S10-1188]